MTHIKKHFLKTNLRHWYSCIRTINDINLINSQKKKKILKTSNFLNSRCIPQCDDCIHGTCVGANKCQCYSGYEKHSNGTCIPRCDKGCINGDCTGPDTCTCHDGYIKGSNDNECVPHCEINCFNGYCSEPNACKCLKGI